MTQTWHHCPIGEPLYDAYVAEAKKIFGSDGIAQLKGNILILWRKWREHADHCQNCKLEVKE